MDITLNTHTIASWDNDVKLLLQQKIITLQGLDTAYNEILPRVGKRPYNRLDPTQFATRYTHVRQLLEN